MQDHPQQAAPRRHWIGWGLIAIATLHTAFALYKWPQVLLSLVQRGLWNTVGRDPLTGAVVWFVLFGAVFALFGLAVQSAEKHNDAATIRRLGRGLLLITLLGIVLMPASGFWIALPVAVLMLR